MTAADAPESAPHEPPAAAANRIVMGLTVSVFRFAALCGLEGIGGLAELAGGPLATGELAGRCHQARWRRCAVSTPHVWGLSDAERW